MVSPSTDARLLSPGSRLGRYVIGQRIARGGMAEVYLARREGAARFAKIEALKLVLPHLKDEPAFVDMFLHEARIASQLRHSNVGQVYDLGFADGEYFIAMEFVHGRDVGSVLKTAWGGGDVPLGCTLGIIAAICAGLHHVHELSAPDGEPLGLVHRDISPGNVLVGFDGHVKVVDFGIAKAAGSTNATRTGVVKGKLGYMSPEQCLARPLDRRSDIFNIGILMYELTVGRRLFRADSEFTVMNQIISGDFPRPSEVHPYYPAALERMVMRALNPAPDRRYPTAEELRRDLVAFERQSDLDLSPGPIAQWMARLFGTPLPPTVAAIPDEPTRVTRSRKSSLRTATPWLAAAVAFLAGAIAWEQARSAGERDVAEVAMPMLASAVPTGVAATRAAPDVVADVADAVREPVPTDAVVPVANGDETSIADAPKSAPPKRRASRTNRTSPRTKPAAKPEDARWRHVLPPTLRGEK